MKGPKEVRDWINERRETAKREAAEYALAALQCQRHDCQALRAEVELLKVDLDETIKDSHKQLAEVERLKADIRDARGLMRGMIDAKDGRVARFLIERAERFIQRTADPTDASPASTTDA